jgi:hypothetical protein
MGGWKLNQNESDDPRKKMQDARSAGGGQGGGRGGVRMGIPGMGGGPWGGGGGRRGGGGNESDEDRQRMQEVMTASRSLTVAEAKKDVEVDVFDDQDRKTAIFTDGRKLQKSKDTTNQEVAAHWDGNRLVTDEKTPSGKKMRNIEAHPGPLGFTGQHSVCLRSSGCASREDLTNPPVNTPRSR